LELAREHVDTGRTPVRQEQAQGILVAALGMLAAHIGYGAAKRAS
jgi:hypothetical protein